MWGLGKQPSHWEYEWGTGMGGGENVGWVGGGRAEAPWKERMGTLCYFWGNSLSPVYKTQLSPTNDLLSAPPWETFRAV